MTATDKSPRSPGRDDFTLLLFIAGEGANSRIAQSNVQRLIETYPDRTFHVIHIDVAEDYARAVEHRVSVTPMLIVEAPVAARLYGNLNDWRTVTATLGLPDRPQP